MRIRKRKRTKNIVGRTIKRRAGLVFYGVLGLMCILVFVIIRINKNNGDDYYRRILSQLSYSAREIPAERGEIYDRNGIVLAYNENQYILVAEPKNILDRDDDGYNLDATINAILTICPEYTYDEIKAKIMKNKDSYYVRIINERTEEQKEAFEAYQKEYNNPPKEETPAVTETETQAEETGLIRRILNKVRGKKTTKVKDTRGKVRGCYFETSQKRSYPCGELASTTIGFANSTGGVTGIEKTYDDILKGKPGRKYGYLNQDSTVEIQTVEEQDGDKIISTLDYYIQETCEKLIKEYDETVGCSTSAIMVMNPNNGEIYAMAHSGMFDLNVPDDLPDLKLTEGWDQMSEEEQQKLNKERVDYLVKRWNNFCISSSYEPGSTAKTFTVAAGLEENLMDKDQSFYCDGAGKYNGCLIHCHKTSGHHTLSVTGALMASCNDALMQMAVNFIGKEAFCDYQERFNIGSKTGIDLPDEQSCENQVYHADKMADVDLATNSFGQNYFVTMVQMCAAYSSIVNGGNYYKPHVVKQILDSEGNVKENISPTLVRQTVSSQTCEFLKEALFQVVENGTGNQVRIEGYEVGGKTGTAEKQKYGAAKETYTVSLMAVAPAYNPEVVLYAVVDEPHVPKAENTFQAKGLAKAALEKILPYLGVFPTNDDDASNKYGNFTSAEDDEMYDEDGSFLQNEQDILENEANNPEPNE